MPPLVGHVLVHQIGVIAQLFALQGVAAIIKSEAGGVVPFVFQRLTERETEMIPIHQRCLRRVDPFQHLAAFGLGETVGFEIGQTPVGVAKIRFQAIGAAIGVQGPFRVADCLQHVPSGKGNMGRIGATNRQIVIKRQRAGEIPGQGPDIGQLHQIGFVVRVPFQQDL